MRRFSITALIAFTLVGLAVGDVIASQIRHDALRYASFHAEFVAQSIVAENLSPVSLRRPLHGPELARFDGVIREQALRSGVVRIKIWSPTGVVLYSDEGRLIGRDFKSEAASLQTVLVGGAENEITHLEEPENVFERSFGSLISTYVPITPRGAAAPEAVAEFYQLKGPIDAKVHRAEGFIFGIVFGGLALLFIILWPLLRRHARTLLERNEALVEKTGQMERGSMQTIQMLNRLANAKDPYTGGHIGRVAEIATEVGRRMGLPPTEERALALAAEFHDIGKVAIPDSILLKPGSLDPDEWTEIKKHPALGANIVEGAELFNRSVPGILHHHERFDGGGYPVGLAGRGIPLIARIITAVDAYDAMTTDRPYRQALSNAEAWRRLLDGSGTQFCPETIRVLGDVLGVAPADQEARILPLRATA
ncbi:MAG: HD-GYP domain-containing protein [Actinomycetota bacterium]|nr:HD-GYP domain-containing protein [Actinomycetota bacterium]